MPRKKRTFNADIGFLWNAEDKAELERIAEKKDMTPSDICRQVLRKFIDEFHASEQAAKVPQVSGAGK